MFLTLLAYCLRSEANTDRCALKKARKFDQPLLVLWIEGLGFTACSPHICTSAGPSFVLWQIVREFEPRCFRLNKKVTFDFVAWSLIEAAERHAHSFRIIVVGADQVRPANRTEMLGRELR